MNFFQDSSQSSASGNPIDSFDRLKVRKIVRKYKNNTKAAIRRV